MRALLSTVLISACLGSCARQIEVQSDTRWTGTVNQACVEGQGDCVYELWDSAPSFTFTKQTVDGYLGVRFVKGRGDEPETTAPYGTIWGSAW
jgi:hypothetical protein